ncbi:MAG: hypothetical protein CBB84_006740 [Phycisphaera sp. TMED24]|jgi:hypothetical protein|nr:MAG: hypothetical protein CBB84_007565 [Phycisphaera sp. TMED24]RPG08460.1 MAG: hypothetical protein CBB84_006740 [Phycisphaera sp. TMED24]
MTLESNLNPNDLQPPPRITGSLILIHAISGLCCGVFGLVQMLQPDAYAGLFVSGYEGPDVPQVIKVVGVAAMAPLPLVVILEAMAGIGLITASRKAVARLRWWAILRALLAALGLILGVLTKDANVEFQLEMYEAMTVAGVPDEFLPKSVEEVEQGFKIGLLVGLLLGLAAPIGVGLWLMGGRGTRLQERLDMWRVATGGRP